MGEGYTWLKGAKLATVSRPPVNEVVLSVSFQPQSCLSGPQLFRTLSHLMDMFSRVEEQIPYEMPLEQPLEEQVIHRSATEFRFVDLPPSIERRYWLTSDDRSPFLVQAQSNYFALNWRRMEGTDEYPGFGHLKSEFDRLFKMLKDSVIESGGDDLGIHQVEVTYINILSVNELWVNRDDIREVIAIDSPALDGAEQINFNTSHSVYDTEGVFIGRVHSSVRTAFQPKENQGEIRAIKYKDLDPIISISLTVRSGRMRGLTKNKVSDFFDVAHDEATRSFRALTTKTALGKWGLA